MSLSEILGVAKPLVVLLTGLFNLVEIRGVEVAIGVLRASLFDVGIGAAVGAGEALTFSGVGVNSFFFLLPVVQQKVNVLNGITSLSIIQHVSADFCLICNEDRIGW